MSGGSNLVGGYGAGTHVPDSPHGAHLAQDTQRRDATEHKTKQVSFNTLPGKWSPDIGFETSLSESSDDDESDSKELRLLREELSAAGLTFNDREWEQIQQAGVGVHPTNKEYAWNLKIADLALKYRNLKLFERIAPSLDPDDIQQLKVDLEAFLKIITLHLEKS